MNALLAHELRSLLAGFRRRPVIPLVAVATLALGLAANVAVFTVISRTLLRPLPYADPDRLLVVDSLFVAPDRSETPYPSGSVEIVQWQRRATRFAGIEGVRVLGMTLRDNGEPEGISGATATGGLFRLLGVRPAFGRDFLPEDDVPEARVAIVRHGFWLRRFGGDPAALGRTITVDGRSVRIVGVLPRGFELAAVTPQPEIFVPAGLSPANMPTPGSRAYRVYGRLRDGVTAAVAAADLRRVSEAAAREFPDSNEHWTGGVRTLSEAAFGDRRQALLTLWLAVALLHVLACVNVASLLSVQIADERGTTALRLAVGASRGQVLRYRLLESLLLTGVGLVAGLALGAAALRVLLRGSTDTLLASAVERAWAVPLFLVALSLATALLVALVPALRETRTPLREALDEQGNRASSSVRGTRLREAFLIAEVALAVPLLLAAAAAVERFRELRRTDVGLDAAGVLVAQLILPPRYDDKASRASFARELLRRVEEIPGVASAATTTCNFQPGSAVTSMIGSGRSPEPISVNFRRITPRYFETLRLPLVAGRPFAASDALDAPPVAIVSASLARRFFGDANPLGQLIVRTPPNPPATIVGVARDVQDDGASVPPLPTLYLPFLQGNNIYLTLLVRARGSAQEVIQPVRRAVSSLDRDLSPSEEYDLGRRLRDATAADRLQAYMLSAFGVVALALATVGIYGMTAYSVAQRAREIAVRKAFGATPQDITVELVRRAARSAAIGLAAGLALAIAAQRATALAMPEAAPFDLRSALLVVATLFVAALVAASVPSLRAARSARSKRGSPTHRSHADSID